MCRYKNLKLWFLAEFQGRSSVALVSVVMDSSIHFLHALSVRYVVFLFFSPRRNLHWFFKLPKSWSGNKSAVNQKREINIQVNKQSHALRKKLTPVSITSNLVYYYPPSIQQNILKDKICRIYLHTPPSSIQNTKKLYTFFSSILFCLAFSIFLCLLSHSHSL